MTNIFKKRLVSFAILSVIFNLLIPLTAGAAFVDVPDNSIYAQDVDYLENIGAVKSGIDAKFEANSMVTRAEFAKWVLRNAGYAKKAYKPLTKSRFKDVPLNNKYASYIYKLVDIGVFEIKNGGLFHPNNPVTKVEALNWIFEIEGISAPKIFDEAAFQAIDIKPTSKIAPLINKAIGIGLVPPGKVLPYAPVRRGEAAHLLRMAKNTGSALTVTLIPTTDSDLLTNPTFDVMSRAWNRIFSKYLRKDKISRDALIYGAIEGMVKELGDKHSNFERPGDNALLESLSGEIEGIGAVIQMTDADEVEVVAPIAGSPAEKAGILAGDIIVKVDDVAVKGLKLNDVVAKIKGKKGTQVKITVKRATKEVSYTITRDVIKIVSAEMKRTSDNIAQISITSFGNNTPLEFQPILEDLAKNPPKAIVIDLRNNPGGFLDTAVELGGYFVEPGKAITTVRYPDRSEEFNSHGDAQLGKYKIAVIVNKGSASASEILAGALQDYGLAKIVGEQSYGKGTVQELSDFSDGSTLKITVAEWLKPKGGTIDSVGITPDFAVKITDEDRKAGLDPQMLKALETVR